MILALHAVLVLWGAARNSVTFDENFHLPSGFVAVTDANFRVSEVNPPLVKAVCAVPLVALGAHPPDPGAVLTGDQWKVGESFMRANAARYHSLYFAARGVILLISIGLGLLVWRWAMSLYGPRGSTLSLAVYAFLPETLAHAGLATMDLATALGFSASVYAFWKFSRSGLWRDWMWVVLAVGATSLIRFTSWLLLPIFVLLLGVDIAMGGTRRPGRVALGVILLLPAIALALDIGYLGQISLDPLVTFGFTSRAFQDLRQAFPDLCVPLPVSYLAGFDHQIRENEGIAPTYLLGQIYTTKILTYFPLAMLFKWPVAFFGLLSMRLLQRLRTTVFRSDALFVVLPPVVFLLTMVFFGQLNAGIRYIYPVLPFLCVGLGGLLAGPEPTSGARGAGRARTRMAVGLLALLLMETAACAPWYLTFFNWPSGASGRGDRLLNDSNVDWGQGLIALKEEMARRGIQRIHLSYHGTTDPGIYGIDYVSGERAADSEWLAVSSYFLVGLSQRMMTAQGPTEFVNIDYTGLRETTPVARPARCMYLFRRRSSL